MDLKKFSKLSNEQFGFLVDIEAIKFCNDGLKEIFNNLVTLVQNNGVKNYIEEFNLSEETIEFHEFDKIMLDKKEYSSLSEEMKEQYKDFWFKRLVYFTNIDYMWDKETFEPFNLLILENNIINESSNLEILGNSIKNGLYVNQELIEKTPLLSNDIINVDLDAFEKFNSIKYKMPTKNIELISKERDKFYYVNYIKNINDISDIMVLASILDDLNKMDDNLFAEIIISAFCSEEELKQSNPIDLLIKNSRYKNDWITFNSGTSRAYIKAHEKVYAKVLGYDLDHGDLSNEILNIIHKFNIKINTILFNKFNEKKDKVLEKEVFRAMVSLMEKCILLPEITLSIDPLVSHKIKDFTNRKMKNIKVDINEDIVKINTNDDYPEFKMLFAKTLGNISTSGLFNLFDTLNDDFTYNQKTVADTNIAFGMYKLCQEYGTNISDNVKIIQNKLLLKLLENRNSINTEVLTLNHFILGEKITEIDKMSLEEKIMLCSTVNDRSNLLVKLLHDDFKNNFKVNDININIDSFYEEEEKIKTKTIVKAQEIFNILKEEKNFVAKNFAKLLGVDSENETIINYEKEFYKNILVETEVFEYLRFNNLEDIKEYYSFKELLMSKDVESYKYKSIDNYVMINILSCMLANEVSEDYVKKFIDQNERRNLEKINFKDCFNYFNKKKKINFNINELVKFYYNSYAYQDTNENKVDRLNALIDLSNEALFCLIKPKYQEKITQLIADLYNKENWVSETSEEERKTLVENLYKSNLLQGNMTELIIKKEKSNLIKQKCLEFLFSDYYNNNERIINIIKEDNFTLFSKEKNELDFLKNIEKNIVFMREKSLNDILSIVENKESVFEKIWLRFNKPNQIGFKLNEIKADFLNSDNKRLFKKIVFLLNNDILSDKKKDFEWGEYILIVIKKTNAIADFFSPSFRYENSFIELISNLSKITQEEFNRKNSVNKELKKELVGTYMLLPSELSKIAVDKLNEGKLFHITLSELNLINKINSREEKNEPIVRQKKKI